MVKVYENAIFELIEEDGTYECHYKPTGDSKVLEERNIKHAIEKVYDMTMAVLENKGECETINIWR